MPLIKCPMCNKEISPNAISCPNCGEPIKDRASLNQNEQVDKVESCNLILSDTGKAKINVIRKVREITGLGLADAKDIVDNVPSIIAENIDWDTAKKIEQTFNSIGAIVKVVSINGGTIIESNEANTTLIKSTPDKGSPIYSNMKNEVKCPKCGSTQIAANKKGFGLGKAVGGAVLLGGVGLLGGFLGSGNVKVTCLKCGYEWKAGKR